MNKRTLVLIVVLLALVAGTYYFISRPDTAGTLDLKETNFAVQDTASITRIFMSTRAGYNNLLERKGTGKWLLNNKYQANPTMVNLVLETIHRMQVKRPVSRSARNTVVRTLATQGTKVELYTKEGKLKTFYVGGNTQDEMGSHFLMEGAEEPYVLHIRGFDGYLSSRFAMPEKDLRDRTLFSSIPPSIEQLKVEHLDTPAHSFTIRQHKGRFVVNELPDADTLKVMQYVASFRNLVAEEFITDAPQRYLDSLSLIQPRMVLSLTDANPQKSNRLVIFANPTDPDRMVAWAGTKGQELVTIQKYTFGSVLIRKKDLASGKSAR